MPKTHLDKISSALGSQACTLSESASAGHFYSSEATLVEAGFRAHYRCGENESAYELARRVVEGMEFAPSEITSLIYASCLPINENLGDVREFAKDGDVKHLLDFPASHLQADFDLQCPVIGLSQQACTGMLGAIRLGTALLMAEPQQNAILCVGADRFPAGAKYEQSYNVISDGAAGYILSREAQGFRVIGCHAITNGALAFASDEEVVGSFFTYMHRLISESLELCELEVTDIDWVVPQNMNATAWRILAKALGIAEERVAMRLLDKCGHVISSDNIMNLQSLEQEGAINSGDRLLLPMAGYGLNWQCVILEKV